MAQKFLRVRKDGFVISFHEGLVDNPYYEVFEVEDGVNPHSPQFLHPLLDEPEPAEPQAVHPGRVVRVPKTLPAAAE